MKKADPHQLPLLQNSIGASWLPDETIFSLASRYHYLSGHARSHTSAKLLFGAPKGGFPHDLPGHVDHFAKVISGNADNAKSIIVQRSILPLLLAFRSRQLRSYAIAQMRNGSIAGMKGRLGLLANRSGALYPLKACPECIEKDIENHGVAFWHTSLQLPGVWLCPDHSRLLMVSASKRAGQLRYDYLLPHCADLISPFSHQPEEIFEKDGLTHLQLVAETCIQIQSFARMHTFDLAHVSQIVRSRLIFLQLASDAGRLRQNKIFDFFSEANKSFSMIPELQGFKETSTAIYSQLHTVLSERPEGFHIFRAIPLVIGLFGNWNTFMECYSSKPTTSDVLKEKSPSQMEQKKSTFLVAIQNGSSVSAAANVAGVEVATAQTWAAETGFSVPRRASVIKGSKREELLDALQRGKDKSEIAARLNISVPSVNRLLRTEPGLRNSWREVQLTGRRTSTRKAWLQALRATHGLGIKVARSIAKDTYAWLYRNDREWLEQTNVSNRLILKTNHSTVDWAARDASLSNKVDCAGLALYQQNPDQRIHMTDIYRLVPELKAKSHKFNLLPRTKNSIERLLRSANRLSQNSFDIFDNGA